MNNDKPNKRFGRKGHWQRIWRMYPERMKDHHLRLSELHAKKKEMKKTQIRALFNVMVDTPMFAAEFRDELAQAWFDVYAEELESKIAWNWVRFGMREGMFSKDEDGRYFKVQG
jgi:hypothetical protein